MHRWADIFVVAPLSANTLAKMAAGMADNLLTCVARAWDHEAAPMLVRAAGAAAPIAQRPPPVQAWSAGGTCSAGLRALHCRARAAACLQPALAALPNRLRPR